jgi:hypothetical protein
MMTLVFGLVQKDMQRVIGTGMGRMPTVTVTRVRILKREAKVENWCHES